MASAPFVRLEIGGTIATVQTWSVGLSFGQVTMPSNGQLFTWLSAISSSVTTWINATFGPKGMWGTNVTYNRLRCYAYDAAQMHSGAQAQVTVTPITGAATVVFPSQLSIVHSLLTGSPGSGNRGRIYVPITASAPATVGQLTSAWCTGLATSLAALLTSISGTSIAGTAAVPVVAARGSKPYQVLGSVGVDSKIDTQRRRTDKIGPTTPLVAVPI